jgi:carboxypeptidase Q
MKKKLLVVLFFPFFAQAQSSDSAFIKTIADEILANGKAFENLRVLTKQIGGRLAGSPQMVKAEKWGAETLRQAGADTVYMQECMVPQWVRGGKDKATIVRAGAKTQARELAVLALGNSIGSGPKGVTADVVAVASFAELEQRKNEVKGKIVFYNYPFNPSYIRPGQSYGEAGIYRYNGASRAAKYGAVGVMVRSLSGGTNNYPHTGAMRYNDSFPKIPAVALGLEDADYLWQTCSKNANTRVSFTTNGRFLPDTIGHNVIAEIRGTGSPNEYITIGGHLDSWDVNEGAHDDGTGIVQTIEILRAFKAMGFKPKKTIRFVLFANEENGLRGGQKYAEVAKARNEKHVFALESDGGGFTPRGFTLEMPDEKIEKIQPWVKLLLPYGAYELKTGGGGADVTPLNTTFNTPVGELLPDNQRYFDLHHAANDVFEAVNKRELLLGAVNMAGLVYLVDKYGL